MVKTLVIAGTQSGVGKTTIVVGLIAALRARGLTVQPFKVGPDYIDAGHHTLTAGRACRNLDTWMMPAERTKALFAQVASSAEVAVIEGVMGLFDGLGYDDETGSTAEIAKLLGAPVVVVIDAAKTARSAAALAKGFRDFDSDVQVAGFIVNRAGSDNHGRGVATAIAQATGLPVLGWLTRQESLNVPERHLGLLPGAELPQQRTFVEAAGRAVAERLDIDKILEMARDVPVRIPAARNASSRSNGKVVIAVARDEAFHFCYEENLTLLEEFGASLQYFSPIEDNALPDGTAGIMLSGGFPEVFADRLSVNTAMHQALRKAHAGGLPIYAECGGLMYLTEAIVDFDGRSHPMVGILGGHSVMTKRLTLGYREAHATRSSWLFKENEIVRGHEFHYSTWSNRPTSLAPAYFLTSPTGRSEPAYEGACLGNLWASYLHVHFWSKPELAERFVAACAQAPG